MARAPLLQLSDIALTFGGDPLFQGLNLVVQPGDRVALVGRNGSGKSTLMKVMARLVEPDSGTRVVPPGITVAQLLERTGEGHAELIAEVNGRFVHPRDYAATEVPAGARVEFILAAFGG